MSSRDSSGQGPHPDPEFHTWLQANYPRLRSVTQRTLNGFPAVSRWDGADDVLQSALFRLFQALHRTQPASAKAFFSLAMKEVRRECLDLARRNKRPAWKALHPPGAAGVDQVPHPDKGPDELEDRSALHEAVGKLLPAERELLRLHCYEGWSHAEIAARLGTRERTVQRHWADLVEKLRCLLRAR
jgi:RNA polymerase sigma-70 factor (ECF subfamily)